MGDRRRRRIAVVVGALGLVLGPTSGAADAEAPTSSGWWTSLLAGPLGQAAGPDVPEDGLLVQAGSRPDTPVAYAAIGYRIPSGHAASSLTLRVAPNAVSTPDPLRICPLTVATFEPAQGGSIDEAPAYDDGRCIEVLHVSGTYGADLAGAGIVATGDVLNLAVVPGSAGRVVLEQPDADSLQTAPVVTPPSGGATPGPSGPESTPPDQLAGPAAGASGPFGAIPTPNSSSVGGGAVGPPAPLSAPASPVSDESEPAGIGVDDDVPNAPVSSTDDAAGDVGPISDTGSSRAPLDFLALLSATGGTWWLAGRSASNGELFAEGALTERAEDRAIPISRRP